MASITAKEFLARLAKGLPMPAVLLLGSDAYLRDLCRQKLLEVFVPEGARDWAVARFSLAESDWRTVYERAQTLPMLSSRQVVFVEDVEVLERLGEETREEVLESIAAYLDDPAPFTVLVLEAAVFDQRRKLYKTLSEKTLTVQLSVGSAEASALAAEMARGLGAEIEPDAAALLADILNHEPARIRIELEKLSLYAGERRRITTADVEALVVSARAYSVWQLADMLAERRRDAALEFLDSLLREGEQPAGIVGALAWMYRKLIEARELAGQTSGGQAARQLGMPPDKAEQAMARARRIPRAALLEGIVALSEADNRLKSGTVDHRAVMEFLVARLTASSAASAG